MVPNKSLIFSAVPTHAPIPGEHITLEDRPFDPSQAPPPRGLTAKTLWISLDPYMRGRMRPATSSSYSPAYTLGAPLTAYALVQVLASDAEAFNPGDIVYGQFPVAEYSAIPHEMLDRPLVRKVRALEAEAGIPLSAWLSVLGSTGLTAYASLYKIGRPKRGETIFVSSAAGAVGLFVGQIARIEGLTVIGSVGDDAKLRFIRENGFHDGFNYKKERTADALKRLAPQGIDIYYDNVGGEQLEAAIEAINNFGRIGRSSFLCTVCSCFFSGVVVGFFGCPGSPPFPETLTTVDRPTDRPAALP
jgi:NADPH-dependent curcumin reductase CurA